MLEWKMARPGRPYPCPWLCPLPCAVILLLALLAPLAIPLTPPSTRLLPGSACREGRCSTDNCDKETRWYLNGTRGLLTDGPGNYSVSMHCTWLIDGRSTAGTGEGARVHLRVESLQTECGWDNVYVWDGDSTREPLLATLSGNIQDEGNSPFELTAYSGMAYVHFFSDVALTMPGFNISYEVNRCNCSSMHGQCVERPSDGPLCLCEKGWTGPSCDEPKGCPDSYSCQNGGRCADSGACQCPPAFRGVDCSVPTWEGLWERVPFPGDQPVPAPSASHSAVLADRQDVYWVGGESFGAEKDMKRVHRLDLASMEWQLLSSTSGANPQKRYAHTTVAYNDSIYMYGGFVNSTIVSNELWQWEPKHEVWVLRQFNKECRVGCLPIPTAGHTAHVVDHKMLIFFGYGGPEYGFLNIVQEINLRSPPHNKRWSIVPTSGTYVYGTYGHSSVYDAKSNMVYIYGGFLPNQGRDPLNADSPKRLFLDNLWVRLLAYDPQKAYFKRMRDSPMPRFLHTGVLFSADAGMDDGILWFFGGNPRNETFVSRSAPCYTGDMVAYDIRCDQWHVMKTPKMNFDSIRLARYGHAAFMFKDQMYVLGGFQGKLLNEVLRFSPGQCRFAPSRETCLSIAMVGRKCAWNERSKQCTDGSTLLPGYEHVKCASANKDADEFKCSREVGMGCNMCLGTSLDCHWCKGSGLYGCTMQPCRDEGSLLTAISSCPREPDVFCSTFFNCQGCVTLSNNTCMWQREGVGRGGDCVPRVVPGPPQDLAETVSSSCDIPCTQRSTCETCTNSNGLCMWCANEERCVDPMAYNVVFSYGQCRDWTSTSRKCPTLGKCHGYKSCRSCLENPDCGWCDDGSGTGRGQCGMGSQRGPWETETCPSKLWYFSSCPACNCNGHAQCVNNSHTCQPCQDFTEGNNCEKCVSDFYGDPRNGGNCTECNCPDNAYGCDSETGNCKCSTKGTTGRMCDKCDELNHYSSHNGACFYELPIGYQFTFNLTKVEDSHFTSINFKSSPPERDFDVKFTLVCTNSSLVNVSYKTAVMAREELLIGSAVCSLEHKLDRVFSHDQLPFGQEGLNTTVFVYVHDFATPSVIVISFAQHASLDLLHFFVVFACCFLSLLLLAAVGWKVKQRYDLYRRRQRMFVEMEQMAKRPFACINLDLTRGASSEVDRATGTVRPLKRPLKNLLRPALVSSEALADGRHGVVSALIALPNGGGPGYAPWGQTGLCVGSALVTLQPGSHTRKPSLESNPKDKLKKQTHTAHSPEPDPT
ncbi:attractin-like [Paramacrobiotus metropolitanus]|uniref:attractin-like n=1 Tax=Paramacrobiotus metropolitanus TaxID=2943436 RepID=UPI002445D158|nr:attractin-like [Paramacrobiotus metropolitanus]